MKKKIIILIVALLIIQVVALVANRTFFKTTYIGVQNQKIFIPRFSYFKDECCMTAATFYSLKTKKELKKEINNYLKDFKYFENDETYGYQNGDLFIQNYDVVDKFFYRKIIITY